MNLANRITVARNALLPLIILAYYCLPVYGQITAGVLCAIACLTDFADGYIARKYNMVSRFGAVMDAIADKILISTVLIILVANPLLKLAIAPAMIILAREFAMSGIRTVLAEDGINAKVKTSFVAKLKTTFQMIGVCWLLWYHPNLDLFFAWSNHAIDLTVYWLGMGSLMIAALLSLTSFFSYLKICRPLLTFNQEQQ